MRKSSSDGRGGGNQSNAQSFRVRRFLGENGLQAVHGCVEFMTEGERRVYGMLEASESDSHTSAVLRGNKPYMVVTVVDPHEGKNIVLVDDAVIDLAEAINAVVRTYDDFMEESVQREHED